MAKFVEIVTTNAGTVSLNVKKIHAVKKLTNRADSTASIVTEAVHQGTSVEYFSVDTYKIVMEQIYNS